MVGIILAAGKSKRMRSFLPKVLHNMLGRTMIEWVANSQKNAGIKNIVVVVGVEKEKVINTLGDKFLYAEQKLAQGTADAFKCTEKIIKNFPGEILICCGDTPLLTAQTLKKFIKFHRQKKSFCTILTANVPNASGYGRIIRDSKSEIFKIIEEKDTTNEEKNINEINSGIYCFSSKEVFNYLKFIKPNNQQKEYYLTDLIHILKERNKKVFAYLVNDYKEVLGINNRIEFAESLKSLQQKILNKLMLSGATIINPDTTYIEDKVKINQDVTIYPDTFLEGNTKIKSNCVIGPFTKIKNCIINENCEIQYSVLQDAVIKNNSKIGPFSHIRPHTKIGKKVKVGNFVELKNTKVSDNTNVSHLTYLGDAVVGKNSNIGAGTITCNYDGVKKHKTTIGDNVFIGSDSILVAPVKISKDSYVGAGSVITKDVPSYALGIARGRQVNVKNWVKKKKQLLRLHIRR